MAWLAFVVIGSIVWTVWAIWNRNSRPRVVARALEKVWAQLQKTHGVKDFYSGSEVAAALSAAAVTDDIAPFAYARYCREADFVAAPSNAGHSYRALREELLQGGGSRPRYRPPQHRTNI